MGDALRVFEDGRLRSSLVWDESKLKNTRTCVSWVSPNYWATGSIYGSVRFDFDWKELVRGKKFYWVEAMPLYHPPAYRILISSNDHSVLTRYDPVKGEGPLFYDAKTQIWYRNGNFTGEFLIDEDLWLPECKRVGFVDHHPRVCRKARSRCVHLGTSGHQAGAQLLARLIADNVLVPKELFLDGSAKQKRLHDEAACVLRHLRKSLRVNKSSRGTLTHAHRPAMYLITAILHRFGLRHPKASAALCGLFRSTD
ncbi:MAG: hypothetical protein AAB225_11575 [Acidobacteriota bacterium]